MSEGRPKDLNKTTGWKRKPTLPPEEKKKRFLQRMFRALTGRGPVGPPRAVGLIQRARREMLQDFARTPGKMPMAVLRHVLKPLKPFAWYGGRTLKRKHDASRPAWANKRDRRREQYPRGERR